jgi:outer membrane protein assembly factor BamB
MELKWAQNTKDDINGTPIFEWGEDGVGYIYTGTSMEYAKGSTYIHKLNANTGEIVWERKFTDVAYNEKVSGGVLSSPLIGKKGTELEGLIIYPIARTPSTGSGTIVALDTETGETVWEVVNRNYHWSSPVAVYGEDGTAHIILCDSAGKAKMYNAKGEEKFQLSLGSNVEASPAVFENTLVVGTRGQTIYGITIE